MCNDAGDAKCQKLPFFIYFFAKGTVPITCAAVKSPHSKLLCFIIHSLKVNNSPSLFKSLPFQCNKSCACFCVLTLLLLPILYLKNTYPSPSFPTEEQLFVDLAFHHRIDSIRSSGAAQSNPKDTPRARFPGNLVSFLQFTTVHFFSSR